MRSASFTASGRVRDSFKNSLAVLLCGALFIGSAAAATSDESPVQAADASSSEPLLTVQTADGTVRDGSVIANGTAVALSVGSLLEEGDGLSLIHI